MLYSKLETKLIGGFIVAAVVTLAVGLVGWRGTVKLTGQWERMSRVDLPAEASLHSLKEEFDAIRMNVCTLMMNPRLDESRDWRQFNSNDNYIRSIYSHDWSRYEALPKTGMETELWKQFKAVWDDLKRQDDDLFEKIKAFNVFDIRNPEDFSWQIRTFQDDHLTLTRQALLMLKGNQIFDGGDDPAACPFGRWLAMFRSGNADLQRLIREIGPLHAAFHDTLAKIKAAVKDGRTEEALALFEAKMMPVQKQLLNRMDALASEQAGETDSLKEQAREVREKQERADALLSELIWLSRQSAEHVQTDADRLAAVSNRMAFVGAVLGFLFVLGIGLFIRRSIVERADAFMGELVDFTLDISRASEDTSEKIKTMLVSLNAAVEAQRAGETGTGVVMVADEMRNLAIRADEAVRNTSELIRKMRRGRWQIKIVWKKRLNSTAGDILQKPSRGQSG